MHQIGLSDFSKASSRPFDQYATVADIPASQDINTIVLIGEDPTDMYFYDDDTDQWLPLDTELINMSSKVNWTETDVNSIEYVADQPVLYIVNSEAELRTIETANMLDYATIQGTRLHFIYSNLGTWIPIRRLNYITQFMGGN